MKKLYLLITSLMLLLTRLQSAEIVHSIIVPETLVNWAVTADVPKFDLTNTLTGVKLELYNNITNTIVYENRDPGMTGVVRHNIQVKSRAESPILTPVQSEYSYVTTNTVSRFDGVVDFAGTSGFKTFNTTSSSARSTQGGITNFIGTDTFPVSVSSVATHQYGGPGDYVYNVSTRSEVLLKIIYTYNP